MMRHLSINLLLGCAAFVYSIEECLAEAENTSLYQREIDAIPIGLRMFHENGTLVEITVEEKPDENDVSLRQLEEPITFNLFTRRNPNNSQLLWVNDTENLGQSHFGSRRLTRFITHGWSSSQNSPACTLIRDAYLAKSDCNVIVLNWSGIAHKSYIQASNQVLSIALKVAAMIDFLVDYGRLNPDKTTLVGHSLGAHVMGLAGYHSKHKIGHIVGLDPALPMFRFARPGSSISNRDAKHVQIIHTNGGVLGFMKAVGHTDFYPNGGSTQPGCGIDPFACSCSHQRAYYIFAESIRTSKPFYGSRCSSYDNYLRGYCLPRRVIPIGGTNLNLAKPGKYYLRTRSKPPYLI